MCSLIYMCSHEYSFLSMDIFCTYACVEFVCANSELSLVSEHLHVLTCPSSKHRHLLAYMSTFTQVQTLNAASCQPKYAYSHACSLDHSHNLLFPSMVMCQYVAHVHTYLVCKKNKHILAYMHIFTHIKFPCTDNIIIIHMLPYM